MKLNLEEYFFPIPGTAQEDKIVIFARKHWVAYLGHILLSIVILLIPIIIYIIIKSSHFNISSNFIVNLLTIMMGIYYLISLTFIFTGWITFYYDMYVVTSEEIIDVTQEGLFGRKISQLSMLRVQDVNSHIAGFLPTLFAFGDVLIETAAESENFLLEDVPNPQSFAARVSELHAQLVSRDSRSNQISEGEGDLSKPISQPMDHGEVTKDDLKKGGEVKF